MTTWRFIDAGPTEPATSFGRFPSVAARVAGGGEPVVMTSVWARAHFNVGWFDDVDSTLDLEADEEHAGRAIELVRKYCTSEELLERCKWAVQEVLDATKVVAEGMERVCS